MSKPSRRATSAKTDVIYDRIAAYRFQQGVVDVARINRDYRLSSRRTGRPVARLRLTGDGDRVRVYWWRREAWGDPGPFGPEVMPLDRALAFIAEADFFWIHA